MNGAAAAASFGLMSAALFACSSDDSTTVPPTLDAGDSSTTTDAAHDSAATDAPTTTDAMADTGTGTDAPVTDSGHDAGDAAADAADTAAPPLPPVALCATLDTDSQYDIANNGPDTPPPISVDDRLGTWGTKLTFDGANPSYLNDMFNDCRINGMYLQNLQGNASAISDFLDQVLPFNMAFLGCPVDDSGTLSFAQLIPAGASAHLFTQADLAVIVDLYANAVAEVAADEWGLSYSGNGVPPSTEPITLDQIDNVKAHLTALAAAMPGINPSTTRLTYSTCGEDAGADAGDAGDAGHD
jgi:hypothetical protein